MFANGVHSVMFADPFHFLEDGTRPETVAWQREQKLKADASFPECRRGTLESEIAALRSVDVVTLVAAPASCGSRLFVAARRCDSEKERLLELVIDGLGVKRTTIVDLAQSASASRFKWLSPSADGNFLCAGVEANSGCTVAVPFDVRGRRPIRAPLLLAPGSSFCWLGGGTRSLYTNADAGSPRTTRLYLVDDPAEDARTVDAAGVTLSGSIENRLLISPDGRWLVMSVLYEGNVTTVFAGDMRAGDWSFRRCAPDFGGHVILSVSDSSVHIAGERRDMTWELSRVDLSPSGHSWTRVPALAENDVVRDMCCSRDGPVIAVLRAATPKVLRIRKDGTSVQLRVPSTATVDLLAAGANSSSVFAVGESFAVPPAVFRLFTTRRWEMLWPRENDVLQSSVVVSRRMVPSWDGVSVPVCLVRSVRGRRRAAAAVQGYGGFGICSTPRFDAGAVVWVRHGNVYALAQIRGGGEMGAQWHRAGARLAKKRSIDDLAASITYVASLSHVDPARVALIGESHGGMVAAAVLAGGGAPVASAALVSPITDMLRYHLFGAGRHWSAEFGSPQDSIDYDNLASYSPYHNLMRDPGASILVVASSTDEVVDSMHARKLVARLQQLATAQAPVLLLDQPGRSHADMSLRSCDASTLSAIWSFLTWQMSHEGGARTPPRGHAR
jgi:prolyl oligopeptidase